MSDEVRDPRILIARGGAIGDFILTLPAIQALRDRWPNAHIELMGYPHIAELARSTGLVNEIQSLDKAEMAHYFSFKPTISEAQAAYMRSFDFVISYLYDPAGTAVDNMRLTGVNQVIYQPPQVEEGHAIEHLMKPLAELAIFPVGEPRPCLSLDDAARERGKNRVSEFGSNVLAIHPGSGSLQKNWPLERFITVAHAARDQLSLDPLFLIGEAEVENLPEIQDLHEDIPLVSHLSLVELAEALSACRGYLGNDSGATHVAAAVGVPVIALFGPSDSSTWGPRGEQTEILDGFETIDAEQVLNAVRRFSR